MRKRRIACFAVAAVIASALALGSCGDTEELAEETPKGLAGNTEELADSTGKPADEAPNEQSVQTVEQDKEFKQITEEQLVWFKSLPLTPEEVSYETEEARRWVECPFSTLQLEVIASMAGDNVQAVVFDRSKKTTGLSWEVFSYHLEGRDGISLVLGDLDSDCPNLQRTCLRLDYESLHGIIQRIKTPDGQDMDVVQVLVNRHNTDRIQGRITPAL